MANKTCAFVRGGNTSVTPPKNFAGQLLLVGIAHRCSWQQENDDESIFDDFMHDSMKFSIDSTLTAIKHLSVKGGRPGSLLVVNLTQRTADSGSREADLFSSTIKEAKRSGWQCAAMCRSAMYLKGFEAADMLDLIVYSDGKLPVSKQRASAPAGLKTKDSLSDADKIAHVMTGLFR